MELATEFVILLLLIILNGVFAMAETAVVSARRARLHQWAASGDPGARTALELADAPNRFLSTVQVGITLIGILAGAYGGATLAEGVSGLLVGVPAFVRYREAIGFGVVVLGITYVSLILGELVPKRLALHNPERVASWVAQPMSALSRLAAPIVFFLSASTDFVLRLLRLRPSEDPPITEAEITHLVEQGAEVGVLAAAEEEMVKRVFRLNDLRVSSLMTPRTEISWLDVDDSTAELARKIGDSGFSRFPVVAGSPDNVLGIVRAKDLLVQHFAGQALDLRAALRSPLMVPESMTLNKLLEEFRQTGAHLALVVDEYGGVSGLVSINNILEAIIGAIPLSSTQSEPMAVQREDGSWLLDGLFTIVELKDLFQLASLPDEGQGDFNTLGGFMMVQLGRVPAAADHFEWNGLRFEVVDMDGNRVDKVLVKRLPAPSESAPAAS